MLIFASALAAIIPMLIYLIIIWRFDRYDREPFGKVLQNYLWGALGAIFFAVVGSLIFTAGISIFVSDSQSVNNIGTIAIAPFVEEITKGAFLLITVMDRKFDNMTDGIVYGGAIGLGFGMTENFFYFISYSETVSGWLALVLIRTLFSAVMHGVATATFGAFIGYAKFKKMNVRISLGLLGLALAMGIHFAWNFSVSFVGSPLLGFGFMIVTVIIFIIVFNASILSEKKIIFRELLPEADSGLIPVEHLSILSSSKRNKAGWVNEKIRKSYVKAATTLAFRKMQFRNSSGLSRVYYETDINNYRNFIHNLLLEDSSV